MSKGCIEWEHNSQEGLVIKIKTPSIEPATAAAAGEALQHAATAKKEVLLTIRGLIDLALQRMEEKGPAGQTGQKIKVE